MDQDATDTVASASGENSLAIHNLFTPARQTVPMTMQVYRSVGMSTVRCEGNICFGGSAEALERTVQKFATGIVVIDLEHVVLVDARGVGALVALHQWTAERGVRLYLANPRPHVQELLRITNLGFLLHEELVALAS
jgi:anti-anti-sigma factor